MSDVPLVEMLYHRRDFFEAEYRFRWHAHPFWQLEIALEGRIEVSLESGRQELAAGDFFVIPPQQRHSLAYLGERNEYVSIKYRLGEGHRFSRCGRIDCDEVLARFRSLMVALLPEGEHAPLVRGGALACVLEGALVYMEGNVQPREEQERDRGHSLVDRALRLLEEQPGSLRQVGDVASTLGVNQAYLSAKFREETGINLKGKIDAATMGHARFLLSFSNHSISGIAVRLSFPDIFAFSRFFSRHEGESPRAFRSRIRG